jgi:hypothetical protein
MTESADMFVDLNDTSLRGEPDTAGQRKAPEASDHPLFLDFHRATTTS